MRFDARKANFRAKNGGKTGAAVHKRREWAPRKGFAHKVAGGAMHTIHTDSS